jgi:hypothetical protein
MEGAAPEAPQVPGESKPPLLETIVWERNEIGKVLEVLVVSDSLVDAGDPLLSVDTSLAGQQLALLTLADQVAMRVRAGNIGVGSESFNNRFQKLAERLSSSISQSEYRNEVEVVRVCCKEKFVF